MLGHKFAAMTLDVYSGLFENDLDRVAQRLNERAPLANRKLGSQDPTHPAESRTTECQVALLNVQVARTHRAPARLRRALRPSAQIDADTERPEAP